MEVVAVGGTSLAGTQPQVRRGIAEVELDLEAVVVDTVDLLGDHLRGRAEEDCRRGFGGVGVNSQDEVHLQQILERLAD